MAVEVDNHPTVCPSSNTCIAEWCLAELVIPVQDQKYKEGATLLRHSMLKKVSS